MKEEWELGRAGAAAEKKGDLDRAANLYRAAIRLSNHPDNPTWNMALGKLEERRNQPRKAYTHYRLAIDSQGGYIGGAIEMAHYGDLCERLGYRNEALSVYTRVAVQQEATFAPNQPTAMPKQRTLRAMKAVAHDAAAFEYSYSSRDEEGIREVRLAVKTDPSLWLAHYHLAQWLGNGPGTLAEATREADLAERLAPAEDRRHVLQMRRRKGLTSRADGTTVPST